jgi:transposase
MVQQHALRDFDLAMRDFRAGIKGKPTWRRKGVHEGFRVTDVRGYTDRNGRVHQPKVRMINRRWGEIRPPGGEWVRFRLTRDWTRVAACKSARIKRDLAGRWWVSFVAEPREFERSSTGNVVGVDRGCANSIATSDGLLSSAPGLTAGEQARFLALQRQLARQKKGSNRRERTKRKLARLYARLTDRRKDWAEQATTRLVRANDLTVLEALNTRRMVRHPAPKPDPAAPGRYLPNGATAKARLNRAILASCWGQFERRGLDKAGASHSAHVHFVSARNTSRQCSACGHVAAESRESQARFVCVSCGHQQHADINAAQNIRDRGVAALLRTELCGRTTPPATVTNIRDKRMGRERTRKPGPAGSVNPRGRPAACTTGLAKESPPIQGGVDVNNTRDDKRRPALGNRS